MRTKAMNQALSLSAVALAGFLLTACGAQTDASSETADGTATPAGDMSTAADAASSDFDRTLELHGVTFRVTSPNRGSINQVTVTPAGLEIDNSPLIAEADGTVTGQIQEQNTRPRRKAMVSGISMPIIDGI